MFTSHIRKGLLPAVVGVTLALAACSGTGSDGGGTNTDGTGGTDGSGTSSVSTARIGINEDVFTFHPFDMARVNYPVLRSLYDPLVDYDRETGEPVPHLAESWDIAPDGESVRVQLRPDVTFHNGRHVDADVVVENVEIAQDPETGIGLVGISAPITSATAVSESEVEFQFNQPLSERAITDILQAFAILDPAELDSLDTEPVGAGPYALTTWEPGQRIVLEAYENYWQEDQPLTDRIELVVYDSSEAMAVALESGDVDAILFTPPEVADRLDGRGFPVQASDSGALILNLRINPSVDPFTDRSARQALQYALDRGEVVEAIYHGFSEPAVVPVSPMSPAFDDEYLDRYPFDLEKAAELAEEGGLVGESFTISVDSAQTANIRIAEILAAALKEIGVTVQILPLDSTEYVQALRGSDFQVAIGASGHGAKAPGHLTLNGVFRPSGFLLQGLDASDVAAYEEALAQSMSAQTPEEEAAASASLMEVMLDESWIVSIAYDPSLFAMREGVSGLDYTIDDMIKFHGLTVAE